MGRARAGASTGPPTCPADGAAAEAPGEFPSRAASTRRCTASRLWTMRQYAGFGSAAETNKRYRFLLEQGQTGLSVAFDLPTQMGYDPDAPIARGEVGKVGVSIASLEDMADLFEGIPLDRVSTSMTINATAAILLALYVAVGRRQGVASEQAERARSRTTSSRSTSRAGPTSSRPAPSMRLITDMFAWCRRRRCRAGTPSRSPATTCARPAARRCRRWPSPWPTPIAYVRGRASSAGLAVDELRAAALVLLQRPQRPARGGRQVPGGPAAVGAASCATASAPAIRAR